MKALTQVELDNFVSEFATLLQGAQLQEVIANDRGLALGFQRDRRYWMILDLVPNTPTLLLFKDILPFKKGAKPKPVALFLNSHGKNLYFQGIKVLREHGRVVLLSLGNSQVQCELEIHLIPKQCNLIVRAQGKQISWEKPLVLGPVPFVENPQVPRSYGEVEEQWLALQKNKSAAPKLDPTVQWEKQKEKNLEKKKRALAEIQKQIDSDEDKLWLKAGEHLKAIAYGAADYLNNIPESLQSYIQAEQSVGWNMENCFFKAKQLQAKKEGARERYILLEKEISNLERSTYSAKALKKAPLDLMKKAEARGRKLQLSSGAIAYCGKSASDNLALLRQAKSWDYWLHLKDYPGAHGIIHRKREQILSENEIQQVAEWVARESLAAKTLSLGQRLQVVFVECRFVRPIKGDKLGRVTYHSEKTLSFMMKSP